ncbi:3,4-dihydroxy-2-butanone-4-phosphate synthase [bacterium]|nr:3,4-dihydroxy-2-butanone-4-phosphate synthase [bacterium]
MTLCNIEQLIDDARNGRMFILVDDEDRENEGDLVIPAQMATPDAVNFMATHGRGLICLALTRDRVEKLRLPLMAQANQSRHQTAFTVSIEAREGISTGISAPDRARTVAVAIDPAKGDTDIVSPGHIFPLVARDGGVLVRAGHTEAAVDIARMAGLIPAGVICEIMRDDGTMARMPDLENFAKKHGLNLGSIADLIAYRRRHETIIRRVATMPFHSRFGGDFQMVVFENTLEGIEHIALIKGDISTPEPVLTRMHALHIFTDVLGDDHEGKGGELQQAMQIVGKEGRGVIVLLRENQRRKLADMVSARVNPAPGTSHPIRDYGIGAQILLDLGVKQMVLLTNSRPQAIGLDGYGLSVVDHRPIQ